MSGTLPFRVGDAKTPRFAQHPPEPVADLARPRQRRQRRQRQRWPLLRDMSAPLAGEPGRVGETLWATRGGHGSVVSVL